MFAWPCRLPPHISAGLSRRATPTPRNGNPKEAISALYADAMKSSLLRDSVSGARQEAIPNLPLYGALADDFDLHRNGASNAKLGN